MIHVDSPPFAARQECGKSERLKFVRHHIILTLVLSKNSLCSCSSLGTNGLIAVAMTSKLRCKERN